MRRARGRGLIPCGDAIRGVAMNVTTELTDAPSIVVAAHAGLGESPRWHGGEARLYWVDIAANALHRWHPPSGTREVRVFDAPVACFGFRSGGGLILGMKEGCAVIDDWAGVPRPFGEQVLNGRAHHRMNDGRVDAAGRFWVGSVNSAKDVADAALYRVDADGVVAVIEGGMTTCNGAAFTADGRRFAHTDTPSHTVAVYDADPATGGLAVRRLLHRFAPGVGPDLGRPDGGSFDVDGCYWTAMFDGWRVVRLSPAGQVIAAVPLPVQRPTMIAFGGDDHRTAFVTTAQAGLGGAARAQQPLAGAIFAFRVAVPGVPERQFAG